MHPRPIRQYNFLSYNPAILSHDLACEKGLAAVKR
jgi:hypothetical protein